MALDHELRGVALTKFPGVRRRGHSDLGSRYLWAIEPVSGTSPQAALIARHPDRKALAGLPGSLLRSPAKGRYGSRNDRQKSRGSETPRYSMAEGGLTERGTRRTGGNARIISSPVDPPPRRIVPVRSPRAPSLTFPSGIWPPSVRS